VNECVDLARRAGYFRPGCKVMSLVHAMLLGAQHRDEPRNGGLTARPTQISIGLRGAILNLV
jgi:hypothetical protein